MKLQALGVKFTTGPEILFVGEPVETSVLDRDGNPYWEWKLKVPVIVGCSTDKDIERQEVDKLYIRESALQLDKWEGDPKKGLKIAGWVADFSVNQEICIYQETTIRQWGRDNRSFRLEDRNKSINQRIKERQAAKK